MPLQGSRTIKYNLGEATVETILELAQQLTQQGVDSRSRVEFDKHVGQRDAETYSVTIHEPLQRVG